MGLPVIIAEIGAWVAQSRDRLVHFLFLPMLEEEEKTCPNTPGDMSGWFYTVVQQYDCSICIHITDQLDANLAMAVLCSV